MQGSYANEVMNIIIVESKYFLNFCNLIGVMIARRLQSLPHLSRYLDSIEAIATVPEILEM